MEDQWLSWVKQLHSIAATGLHFGESEYDKERYQQVGDIAQSMLASLANTPVEAIQQLLNDGESGYCTPKVDVRAAIVRNNKILLVQEKNNSLWTMPGGYADVGLSPAENVIKEVQEEASLEVVVRALYNVRHKAKHEFRPDIRDFYKFYFLCDIQGDDEPTPGSEVIAAKFFSLESLPPLCTGRIIHRDLELALQIYDKFTQGDTISTLYD